MVLVALVKEGKKEKKKGKERRRGLPVEGGSEMFYFNLIHNIHTEREKKERKKDSTL